MLNTLKKPKNKELAFGLLLISLLLSFFQYFSCAVVKAPTGGPKDTLPPYFLGSIPKNYTKNFVGNTITLLFDEFIKIKDKNTSVLVSPEPEKQPDIKVIQKSIQIKFKEPLNKNRTYTLNFGNSIIDYNEGNILNNFRYVFSTGPVLDSLKISGTVSDPLDTAAKKDVYVILHPIGNDSAIIKKKPFEFTTTDKYGAFTLENIKPGDYNIYALEETNKNKKYDQKSEKIAFLKKPIHLTKDTNNIQLSLFLENDTLFKALKKNLRNGLLRTFYSQPSDSVSLTLFPIIKNKPYIVEKHGKGDTIYIWLPDPNQDSVVVTAHYKNYKPLKFTQKNFNKPKKLQPFGSSDNIKDNFLSPAQTLEITFSRPVINLPNDKIIVQEDSSLSAPDSIAPSDSSYRKYKIYYPWTLNKKYHLKIKAGALSDIYTLKNLEYDHEFSLADAKRYGTINLHVTTSNLGSYIIYFMDENFTILRKDFIKNSATITYSYIDPGKYRFRIIYDENNNKLFDTGNLLQKIYPERVVNSKIITLRANFELNPIFPLPK